VARTRAEHGAAAVGPLYEALGQAGLHGQAASDERPRRLDAASCCRTALAEAGLPAELAEALEDTSWDAGCRRRPTRRWR
jgi:hypothetical protein